jgi:hypothetical protein
VFFMVDGLPNWYRSMRFRGMGAGTVGGFLWSDSFVCARGRKWLCVQFVGGQVLGACGLRIPGCGW